MSKDYDSDFSFNYDVLEIIHKSSKWGNLILKVRPANRHQIYVLKCFRGIESGLQKTIFYREMEALQVLNSCEGVVNIWDANTNLHPFKDNTEIYGGILMDFVPGETIDDIDWSQFSQLEKYNICCKMINAICNAHSNSVIHRDIKPSNIIYDKEQNKVTVIDFGTSKIKSIVESETTMPMYSEWYSAPELVSGYGITEKCDYYSLGVVIYEILLSEKASYNEDMIDKIKNWASGRKEVKDILISMLQKKPNDRPENLLEVKNVFFRLISELNIQNYKFHFIVDHDKLYRLKRDYVIDKSMNMSQFINSYLRNQFLEGYGYFDPKYSYVITGNNIVINCIYQDGIFYVDYIGEITADRRNINIKRSFKINGTIEFHIDIDSGMIGDNNRLFNMFKNHQADNRQERIREEKFDDLFEQWEEGLREAIQTEKNNSAILKYSRDFQITDNQIILNVDECENKSIDEIIMQTRFIIEGKGKKGVVYYELGILDDIICDDGGIKFFISFPNGRIKPNIRGLLNNAAPVCEDFQVKTLGFRRQFSAIHSLKADRYLAHSLKDIILCLDDPVDIPMITTPTFLSSRLNESQKQAVKKALNTENICLIQGPPGTGKTSVIKEIIGQIVNHAIKTTDSPKILIVSQSHTAVDNILEGLTPVIKDQSEIIRIGSDKNVSKVISEKYTMTAQQTHLIDDISVKVKAHINEKNELLNSIKDEREREKWSKIQMIQKDWLERLVDFESLNYQLVRSAVIIAGTCIGFLSNEIIKDMSFDYVIVDEAAKATTPELLVSIIKAKKIVLVGDQKQLSAYADSKSSPVIAKLTKTPKYRLFDILYESLPETHKQILTTQYRMIANIGNLISEIFYDGKIDTGCSDDEKEHELTRYEGKSIVWFDTSKNQNKMQKKIRGGSFINEEEKRIIIEILDDLKKSKELQGQDIGIITGYSGQRDLLRKTIKAGNYAELASIDINTLDAFQGRENDIIIYSTVRTKDSIGFQKEKERVNVAFSRAKKLLIICGDKDFFYGYDDPENKFIQIIDYIQKHKQCEIIDCNGGELF